MPTLADIYSAINTAKRKTSDFVQNPAISLEQMLGYANDRARDYNQQLTLSAQGFGAPARGQQATPEQLAAQQSVMDTMASAYNPMGMTSKMPNYGTTHRPMTVESGAARLHDLTTAFDDTIYGKTAVQNYGTGVPALDREAVKLFQQVRNKPDAMVTVYRAVPKDAKQTGINTGDWITVSKQYAMQHGEGTLGGNYKIVSQQIPAKHITTNADSILEQGYYP
jgi:hypothetical protein